MKIKNFIWSCLQCTRTFPVDCTSRKVNMITKYLSKCKMQKYNLRPGMRDLAFQLVLMPDGQMGIVWSLGGNIREICFLKDVSDNTGGMCIGRTSEEDLNLPDRPGHGLCEHIALTVCNLWKWAKNVGFYHTDGLKDDQGHNGHQVSWGSRGRLYTC